MSEYDWYEAMRDRLADGEVTPIPHDPEWWARWEQRINNAPAWLNFGNPAPLEERDQ